jgi:hypothetical protein
MRILFLLLCLILLSGCQFDIWEGGFVSKKEGQKAKIGSLTFDRLEDNVLFPYEHDLRKDEHFISHDGSVLGVRLEKDF